MENLIQLTIEDLATLRDIIDVAVTRGTFKANEVRTVGETFEKLDAFINAVQQAKTEPTGPETVPAQGETND